MIEIKKTVATIANGAQRCRFRKTADGWTPDWFYLDKRPMLRFKDHEWMSLSVDRPKLTKVVKHGDNGLQFTGRHKYYKQTCECSVTVSAAADGGGFVVETVYVPKTGDIEIYESGSSFECPYEYDNSEESTTVIGQNPVYKHKGDDIISGLYLESALWVCNRKRRARQTGHCWAPMLAHNVKEKNGGNERWIMVLGHYDDCTFKEVYATPTRNTGDNECRGYKYLVGCTNWSSSEIKDPNFIVRKNQRVTQKVTVDYCNDIAPLTYDEWLMAGWSRMLHYTFPSNGKVEAWDIAGDLGIDWKDANDELVAMFRRKKYANVWNEDEGIKIYLDGSRPAAYGCNARFAQQWYGPLAYQAKVTGNSKLAERVCRLADKHAGAVGEMSAKVNNIGSLPFVINPCVRTLENASPTPKKLQRQIRGFLRKIMKVLAGDSAGRNVNGDFGTLAMLAEMLLLAGSVFDDDKVVKQGLGILQVVNRQLDGKFWRFGCGPMEGWCQAGQQIRALGPGRAVLANILAAELTGRDTFLECAQRFTNYNLALCYATANASPIADMDTRGWANGGTCGRDQLAEMPPLESLEGIRGVAAILNKVPAIAAYYDIVFLAARTGLCMLPAARTHKRVYDPDGNRFFVPVDEFPNEREIYMRGGYIAYENPWDQTMQAPYQGVEPLMNYLTFGGGLARVGDDRVIAIVPDAAHYDYGPDDQCEAHVWNPTKRTIKTSLTFPTKPARTPHIIIDAKGKVVNGKGARDIAVRLPARSVVKVYC